LSKNQVVVSGSVWDYVRAMAPEPRRRCKAAILSLPDGDTKALEGEYESFHRLRVGAHRFTYRYHEVRIEVFFAEQRRLVYDLLAAHISQLFKSEQE
jgi:hypothetical protein